MPYKYPHGMPSSYDPRNYHNLNLRVPVDLYEELRVVSFNTRTPISEIVRRAVATHLEQVD